MLLSDPKGAKEAAYRYNGPSEAVLRIADAVMSQGLISPITPPGRNASWHLRFFGPALRCGKLDGTMAGRVQHNFLEYLRQWSRIDYNFVSWVPIDDAHNEYFRHTDDMPFRATSQNGSLDFNAGSHTIAGPEVLAHLSMFVAIPSGELEGLNLCSSYNNGTKACLGEVLQCQLHNVSYNVSFDYVDGVQKVDIILDHSDDEDRTPVISNISGPITGNWGPCNFMNFTGCVLDADPFAGLSYQAVFHAFVRNILGSISRRSGLLFDQLSDYTSVDIDSKIVETVLVNTKNLASLGQAWQSDDSLQGGLSSTRRLHPQLRGLVTHTNEKPQLSLGNAMEEMFQKLTVSLMSSAALQ